MTISPASLIPVFRKIKAQYHAGSDTHYVVAWFAGKNIDLDLPDVTIKVEKAGAYLEDSDTREEIAMAIVTALQSLAGGEPGW